MQVASSGACHGSTTSVTASTRHVTSPLRAQLSGVERTPATRVARSQASNGRSSYADDVQNSIIAGLTDEQLYSNLRLSQRHQAVLHYFPNALVQ